MPPQISIGLIGYGKAGQAVANVLSQDPRFDLRWIARRSTMDHESHHPGTAVPIVGIEQTPYPQLFEQAPVDALVDFSSPQSIHKYGDEISKRGIMLVSAISAYSEDDLTYARELGQRTRVLCSPNITLGINFLILAAKLLHKIAPFADVEIVEQHFREKPEVSGTARKIAETLEVDGECITSLRLGGIVGHHEVIFGFPHQTVRLTHDSIRREAFGTGAAFALEQLSQLGNGYYCFDDILFKLMRTQLLKG
ncbi:4-hydroxy-tetrahydrodipicolinate reductase [Ferriphaselus amnicola]|uniref:4-hydroxy-tetrahydrodipicolinate reductase n=1 Tax=Ferriphaselus amnicola TaxID=1188319 RepID=A0A2Z6GCR2_9PROT|nr:dihydrodipicolinate reductase C-terminal domain-containing protein [Ferriphaselus amnicola]BBE51109.1 4-hydroxy-tetrahydrodipicolinate reductase [Ferriphaselus amnicola]